MLVVHDAVVAAERELLRLHEGLEVRRTALVLLLQTHQVARGGVVSTATARQVHARLVVKRVVACVLREHHLLWEAQMSLLRSKLARGDSELLRLFLGHAR